MPNQTNPVGAAEKLSGLSKRSMTLFQLQVRFAH